MNKTTELDGRRIGIYLALAFGLAYGTGAIVRLTGGLADSPQIDPVTGLTLAVVLIAGPYMWSPAIATVATRLLTGEGLRNAGLGINLRQAWPYLLATWLLPPLLIALGTVVYFVLFPATFDPSMSVLREQVAMISEQSGVAMSASGLFAISLVQAVFLAPLLNSFFTFGEELGWRAYLQPKLMPLGPWPAMLLMGLIWGAWHWPIIAMGHNYGLDYSGAPWGGLAAMVLFTFSVGVLLGWASFKTGSVWPAVLGHAVLNGFAALAVTFVDGAAATPLGPTPLLGPLPVGAIGGVGFRMVALLLLAL
ncbi:MAG: CPBP family intramembrane metalloprotease, partial [Chloroflexi bacterium]|nr:CPBP family intramembrane metalloprotease [Chloroflexota bacterium]